MAYGSSGVVDITLKSAEDMTTKQYYFVTMGTVEFEAALADGTAGAQATIGILQNKPNTGEEAIVRVLGISKLEMSQGSLSPGAVITADGSGTGEQADADAEWGNAILMNDSAAST